MTQSKTVLTFNEFIALLPTIDIGSADTYEYFTLKVDPKGGQFEVRAKKMLWPTQGSLLHIAKRDLMSQSVIGFRYSQPIKEFYEDIWSKKHLEPGKTYYIVKLGGRMYTVASPQDFKIIENNIGFALCSLKHDEDNHVIELGTITEKEYLESLAEEVKTDTKRLADAEKAEMDRLEELYPTTGKFDVKVDESGWKRIGAMVFKDIDPQAVLTGMAQEALRNQVITTVVKRRVSENEWVYDEVIYLTAVARVENVILALQAVAQDVNLLASKGLIKGRLGEFGQMQLARMGFQGDQVVVFCYPVIENGRKEEAIALCKTSVLVGGLGPTVDTHIPLPWPKNTAGIRFNVSYGLAKDLSSEALVDRIRKHSQDLLSLLPSGTIFKHYEQVAITDLSVPFILYFEHPVFHDVREIKVEHTKEAYSTIEGQVVEQNVLTGVRYLRPDGTSKY